MAPVLRFELRSTVLETVMLDHYTTLILEPATGFEPALGFPTAYKAVAFDHSAKPAILERPLRL